MQNGAHACLAVSAALRASLKMLKGTYPQQATDLAMGTMEALAKVGTQSDTASQAFPRAECRDSVTLPLYMSMEVLRP